VCRASSLKAAESELAKYNFDLVAVFHGNENDNHHLEMGFFILKGIISAFKRVESINDRILCVTLRGSREMHFD
jgi:hypothetical protein